MSSFSNAFEDMIINVFLRNNSSSGAYTPPTKTYVALFTSNPTDAGSGTEASYTGYARREATWVDPAVIGTPGVTRNAAQIDFPANGGATDVTITHVGVYTASTAGTLLFHAPLTATKILAANDVLSFAANALVITLD
jgi:hypothetical protein